MEAIHEKQQGGDDWRDGVLKTERGCRNSDTIKMHVLLQSKPGSSKQWVWELVGCGNEETRKRGKSSGKKRWFNICWLTSTLVYAIAADGTRTAMLPDGPIGGFSDDFDLRILSQDVYVPVEVQIDRIFLRSS